MELTTRVSKLEALTQKLGQSTQLVNEVLTDLTTEFSTAVREQVKKEMVTCKREIESNVLVAVNNSMEEKVEQTVKDTVKETFDERGLSKHDADRLTKARARRMRELLGDSKSDKYKLFISYYQGRFRNRYLKKFSNATTFAGIRPDQFAEAMLFTQKFVMADEEWIIQNLHKTYKYNEFKDIKLKHAYERYFGLPITID